MVAADPVDVTTDVTEVVIYRIIDNASVAHAHPCRLYDLVDYEAYNRVDAGVFNFQIPGVH